MTPQDIVDAVVDAILADDTVKLDRLLRGHSAMPEMRQLARAVRELRLLLRQAVPPASRARHAQMMHDALARQGVTRATSPPQIGP